MYIIDVINFLNKLSEEYKVIGTYYERIKALKTETFEVKNTDELKAFILSEAPQNLKTNILKMANPEIDINSVSEEELSLANLDMLTPNQLLNYVGDIYSSVSFTEKDNLLILKYGINVYNVGWTKFAKHCRGIVIDTNTMTVIGHPFDKFFNINEIDGWREKEVVEKLNKANYVSLTDKKDGSLISVYLYNGTVMLNTNGSFDNVQTKWAFELLQEKYPKFFNFIEDGYTYIFELIHPENKIVLDYGEKKELYLLDIRNMKTNRFFKYEELIAFANKIGFSVTESEEFSSIKELMNNATNMKNANKEGWVLRISNNEEDFFVKIKLAEYFALHRLISSISVKRVYNFYITGTIEQLLTKCNDDTRDDITGIIEEININREKYCEKVIEEANQTLKENNLTREELNASHEIMKDMFMKYGNQRHLFEAMKSEDKLRTNVNRLIYKNYLKLCEE